MNSQRQNHPKPNGFRTRPTATRMRMRKLLDTLRGLTDGTIKTRPMSGFAPVERAAQLKRRVLYLDGDAGIPSIRFYDRTANRPTKIIRFPSLGKAQSGAWVSVDDEEGNLVNLNFRSYEDLLRFLAFTVARYSYQ